MAITISGENNNDRILASDGVLDSISGINAAGIVTATSFTGDLTGDVTGNLTGNVNATSNLLLQIGGSEKFRVASSGQLGIGGANYGTSGQVLTSGGSGSAATWSAIPSQVTINNASGNRVITSDGGTTLNGEANLTYNGSNLALTGNDNQYITIGASADLTLKADGSNSAIVHNGDGDLAILAQGTDENIKLQSAGYTHFLTGGGNERLRIFSNGSVGVGDFSSASLTHAFQALRTSGSTYVSSKNTGGSAVFYAEASNGNTAKLELMQSGIGNFTLEVGSTNALMFKDDGTERLRITSAGNLKMPDAAEIQLGNDTQTATGDLRLFHNGSNSGIINSQGALYIQNTATNSSDLHLQGKSSIQLHCPSDGNVPFKIDSNGWAYFNTTSNGTTNGSVDKRYNIGSTNNANVAFQLTTRQRYSIWEHRQIGRSQERTAQISCGEGGSNQGIVYIYSSAANADVTGGVNLSNGATSWSATSDMRLKNKTGDILNALEDINKIEPLKFTWKYGPDNNPHVGVSAQSVENVVPEAIERGVDVERQREGDETEYMQVRYTELIPLSIAAIKELKAEVESLKAEIASLKSS